MVHRLYKLDNDMIQPCHNHPICMEPLYYCRPIEARAPAQQMFLRFCQSYASRHNLDNICIRQCPMGVCRVMAFRIFCNSNLPVSCLPLPVLVSFPNTAHLFLPFYLYLFYTIQSFYVSNVISPVTVNVPISIVDTAAPLHT